MTSGLYIHVPYCLKKCNYCDFYSIGGSSTVSDEYVDAVIKEIKKYGDIKYKTVYFGGGTPSLLTPQQTERILKTIRNGGTLKNRQRQIRDLSFTIPIGL